MKYYRLIFSLLSLFFFFSSFSQAGFRPSNLPGLDLWLRADTGIVLNSGNVQQWTDQSATVANAAQPASSNQPLFVPSVSLLNNLPAIRFDGVDDDLKMDSTLITGTAFILCNWTGGSTFTKYNGMITISGSGPQPNYVFIGSANSSNLYTNASETCFGSTLYKNGNSTTGFLPMQDYRILSGKDINLHSFSSLTIGNNPIDFGNNHWDGDIAEIIMYDNVLADSNRIKVEQYLKDKYAPPVNLGPDMVINNTFCDTVLTAPSRFVKFLWSTGDTTQSTIVSGSGSYWVKAVSIFGDNSFDTIQVNFNRPVYTQFADSSFCKGGAITWNTGLPKNAFSFLWSDSSTDSLITITAVGDYFVTLTDNLGCSANSDTIHASMDAYKDSISLGPDTSMCSGNILYLKAGAGQTVSYQWNDNSSSGILAVSTSGQYWVNTTDNNGCAASDTITVTIAGQAPSADFSASLGCMGLPVNFTDLSAPPVGNTITAWQWVFDDAASGASDSAIVQNPFHVFSDTGSFSVSLVVLTNAGCGQLKNYTVHVAPKPGLNFSTNLSCQADTTFFTPAIATHGYPSASWHWDFGDASTLNDTSMQASPQYIYPSAASYTATLVVTNSAGCTDSVKKTISVNQEVLADFSFSNACSNAPIQFTDNTIAPLPVSQHTHSWSFNGTAVNGINPMYMFGAAGIYPVSLTVTGTNGCISSVTKPVLVNSSPSAQFSAVNFCKNDSVLINDQSNANQGSITAWEWSLDNAVFSAAQNTVLTSGSSGAHLVKFTVTNSPGCKDSVTKSIIVYSLPVVNFTTNPPVYLYPLQNVTLVPNHNTGNSYSWNASSGFSSMLSSPSVIFPDTGQYTVTLIYADSNNCKNTKQHILSVVPRFTDLAIIGLQPLAQAGNFYSVSATLVNEGTVVINTADLDLVVPNSTTIKETWSGALNPGSATVYTFQAQPLIKNPGSSEFVCSTILSVNGTTDARSDNNDYCAAINSITSLYTLFPNPAGDHVILPFVIDIETHVDMEIFDMAGKLILSRETVFDAPGLNLLNVPLPGIQGGYYTIRVRMNNRTFTQRFLKD